MSLILEIDHKFDKNFLCPPKTQCLLAAKNYLLKIYSYIHLQTYTCNLLNITMYTLTTKLYCLLSVKPYIQ